MNTESTASSLSKSIDQYAGGQPTNRFESHDLESLSRRVLAPVEVQKKLLAQGVLRSEGPVHRNDETGFHSFNSDELNEIRRSVLSAIVEKTIEESDATQPAQVTLAASHALREHVGSFAPKPGAKREFSAFPKGLVQLSRDTTGRFYTEEEPGAVARTATTIGKVAAVGGAGLLGASWLRGRLSRPLGPQLPGARGAIADTLAGLRKNTGDVKKVAGRAGRTLHPPSKRSPPLWQVADNFRHHSAARS